ncbi:hypothetical protein ABZ816_26235 [Actinosynnema sp. NPDC047251]|uniref:Putative secreted protein n=1 Tax=Saccharothrix espanaensis (strain ATCC 51144 / DSM 44229 / JCM 9112 / NBRC 15066 / NRRL 15764) TaxID=1179773 RepID=K0K0M6_SACES|nr:hypothetical protein [Saccharothrix espanaensis]CCH31911.1 putative secreted protein [Saccharothrix espanaensis DSM 44229]
MITRISGVVVLVAGFGLVDVPASASVAVPCDTAALVEAVTELGGQLALAPGCTYTLARPIGDNGFPVITESLTLTGRDTTIRRDPRAPRFRIFQVAQGGSLTLDGITVTGGHTTDAAAPGGSGGSGGAIDNAGQVLLARSTLVGNRTGDGAPAAPVPAGAAGGSGGSGGAVANTGTLVVRQSVLKDNTTGRGARGADGGAAPAAGADGGEGGDGGSGGHGGAIVSSGSLTVVGSTLEGNRTGRGGAGAHGAPGGASTTGTGGRGGKMGFGGPGGDAGAIDSSGVLTVVDTVVTRNGTGDGGPSGDAGAGGRGVAGGAGGGIWGGRESRAGGQGGRGGGIVARSNGPVTLDRVVVVDNRTGDGGAGGRGGDGGAGGRGGDGGAGGRGGAPDGLAGSGAVGGASGDGGGIALGQGPANPVVWIAGGRIAGNRTGHGADGGASGRGGSDLRLGHGGAGGRSGEGAGVHVDRKRSAHLEGVVVTGNATGEGGKGAPSRATGGHGGDPGNRGTGGGVGATWYVPDPPSIELVDNRISGNQPDQCDFVAC